MKMIREWHKLSNGYWLKICFFRPQPKCWVQFGRHRTYLLDIAVGKTRRRVNDHYCSRHGTPKSLHNKSSNHGGGLEALMITLEAIQRFSETLPKGSVIVIEGSDDQRCRVYRRLLRYGFLEAAWCVPYSTWMHKRPYYFKEII